MVRLDDTQQGVLNRLRRAWLAQEEQVMILQRRHEQEMAKLKRDLYENVALSVADGLLYGVPKLQMAKAMDTTVYHNRKDIHDIAVTKLAERKAEQELNQVSNLKDQAFSARWANALTLTYMGTQEGGHEHYAVEDQFSLITDLHVVNGTLSYLGEPVSGIQDALWDNEDVLYRKIEEAKNA